MAQGQQWGLPGFFFTETSSRKTAAFPEIKALVGEVAGGDTSYLFPTPTAQPLSAPPPLLPPHDLTKITERFQTRDVLCVFGRGRREREIHSEALLPLNYL